MGVVGDPGGTQRRAIRFKKRYDLCTAGSGWYQVEGQEPVSMTSGTTVRVPAGTKHWNGAKADSWFSHLAFVTPGEHVSNESLELVDEDAYAVSAAHLTDRPRFWNLLSP